MPVKKKNKKSPATSKKLATKKLKAKTAKPVKKSLKAVKKTSAIKSKIKKVTKAPAKKPLKVAPIPAGYTAVTPYLIVKDAAKALVFYKQAFGAKVIMRFADPKGTIMHAEIKMADAIIMVGEECPEMGACSPASVGGTPVMMHLYVKKVDATFKKAIAAGAKELRSVEDQFYGDRSGCVIDPFGHVWNISTHVEEVSPKEIKKRFQALSDVGE
jgi:PhnB protein